MSFATAEPTEWWIETSSELQAMAWDKSQPHVSEQSRWCAYLNQLCLDTVLPWVITQDYLPYAEVWPQERQLPRFWEFAPGTAIQVGNKRLVLIPSIAIDASEIEVPQEWIDIPTWAGDYYLAVQINLDEHWSRVWGYTTHAQLKTNGQYVPNDRTYCLDATELICDLNSLSLTCHYCPEEITQSKITPLAEISPMHAQNLLTRLTHPEVVLPRLSLPFAMWGAILEQENLHRQLYAQRQTASQTDSSPLSIKINLNQWFEDLYMAGWQSLENLVNANTAPIALNLRQTTVNEREITRAKVLNFGTIDASLLTVLVFTLQLQADERIRIQIQLHPTAEAPYLPTGIQLCLASTDGDVIQFVTAEEQDFYIQLPPFKCSPDVDFSIQVTYNDSQITENFIV